MIFISYISKKYGVAEKELEFDLNKSLKQIYCNSDFVGMKKRIKLLSEEVLRKKIKIHLFLKMRIFLKIYQTGFLKKILIIL